MLPVVPDRHWHDMTWRSVSYWHLPLRWHGLLVRHGLVTPVRQTPRAFIILHTPFSPPPRAHTRTHYSVPKCAGAWGHKLTRPTVLCERPQCVRFAIRSYDCYDTSQTLRDLWGRGVLLFHCHTQHLLGILRSKLDRRCLARYNSFSLCIFMRITLLRAAIATVPPGG